MSDPHKVPLEELLDGLFAVSEAVARAEGLEAVLDAALQGVISGLRADRASVLLFDDEGVMRFRGWRGLSEAYRAAAEGHHPWQGVAAPAPLVILDATTDPSVAELHPVMVAEGVRTLVFVPLLYRDRLLGKFMAYFDQVREPSRADLRLAQILGSHIAFGIARAHSEQELRQRGAELQAVLDVVADGITVHTGDRRLRYANQAAARIAGYPSAEAMIQADDESSTPWETFDAEGEPLPLEALPAWRVMAGEPSAEATFQARNRVSGEGIWTRARSRPVLDEAGQPRLVVSLFEDITDAAIAERHRAFLLEASALLASSLDFERTLDQVARLAVPYLADLCGVRVLDEGGVPQPIAAVHRDPAMGAMAQELLERYEPPPDAPYGVPMVIRTGQEQFAPQVPPDALAAVAQDARHLELLQALELRSVMILPLLARGKVLGAMSFVTTGAGRPYTERDLQLGRDLAERAALAIDNARLYRAAERDRERLAVTLASIGDAVIATDTESRVTLINGVASALVGWTEAEALGRPLAEVFRIFNEATGEPTPDPVERALRTGRVVGLANHTVLEARDGARYAITDSAAPIRDAGGEVIGVVLVFRDVTGEQRLEQELARASKLESLGVLAGGIAHDFNNLLTAVTANLSLAQARLPDDHPLVPRLLAADRACERARGLTHQLLTFARGGAPVKRLLALDQLLPEVCGFALQGSRTQAHFRISPDLWAVEADEGQIGQVFQNIVLNAVQAMPEGGRLDIRADNVSLGPEGGVPLPPGRYVRVRLCDQGPGIPPEVQDRIFDPFFSTKEGGSGLGLATAYSIVKRHDGHIRVEVGPSGGACFEVHLAAHQADGEVVTAGPRRGGRILVMDDDPSLRALAGECLQELGYETDFAADGQEAIEVWTRARDRGVPFDLVVMDLTVPGAMGGQEAMTRLRALDPAVRGVVSSGYSNDPVLARPADYGFVDVIPKPWRLEDLKAVLERHLPPEK